MTEAPEYITAAEIAAELGVHEQTAQRYFRSGGLPGRKIGKHWTTTRAAFSHWLEGCSFPCQCRAPLTHPATVEIETSPIELERKDAEDGAVPG